MKKHLLFIIALLTLFIFSSCGEKNSDSDVVDVNSLPPDQVLNIITDEIADYNVVRGETADDLIVEAAKDIRSAIESTIGVKMGISTDWIKKGEEANIPLHEILIGNTNRPESSAAIEGCEKDVYVIKVIGDKLVINGTTTYATITGVNYFIDNYLKSGITELKLARNTDIRGETVIKREHTVYNISTEFIGRLPYMEQDMTRLLVSLQGLYNRDFEKSDSLIYINMDANDTFWYDYISAEGNFLNGYKITNITSEETLWELFGSIIREHGLVTWDPAVPATANVAATICGVDGYLPIKYDTVNGSLYNKLIELGCDVKSSLVSKFTGSGTIPDTNIESTGSSKCDSYLWALELYIDKCSDRYIAYTLDGAACVPDNPVFINAEGTNSFYNSIYNHDYFVNKKMFVFDLTLNATEVPCDDPGQKKGTDAETLKTILSRFYDRRGGNIAQLIGFPPWWMKYTTFHNNGNIEATVLEWDFTQFISSYNLAKEADAAMPCCMTNASVYCRFPLEESYENTDTSKFEKVEYDSNTKYFTIYMGDYDSSAWLKTMVPKLWTDPVRGTIPIAWGFNPNLSERVPMIWDYMMKNKTDNDFIMAGDSGAGYVIPSALVNSKLRDYPSAADEWVTYCAEFYKRFDLDITGFIINGNNRMEDDVYEMYNIFSPTGSFHNDTSNPLVIYKGVPYLHMMNGISNTPGEETSKSMYEYTTSIGRKMNFSIYRTVQQVPSALKETIDNFIEYANKKSRKYTFQYVDPYTMFDLIKQSGQGKIID